MCRVRKSDARSARRLLPDPIAGFSKLTQEEKITLKGFVISPDGTKIYSESDTSSQADAAKLGQEIGQRLWIKAGSDLVR